MRNSKVVWLVVSCLMALSLVMTSCGSDSEDEEEGGAIAEEESVTAMTPKYGGVHVCLGTESTGFDPREVMVHFTRTLPVSHETLLMGDWAKGPAGTGETDWRLGYLGDTSLTTGCIAESWELPDDETLIYHIREGIKWHDKPPVNGREFTAQDAAWNIEMEWRTPGTNLDIFFKPEDHLTSVTALDDYTLELKFPAQATTIHIMENSHRVFMLPPEITEMYGNQQDWHHSTGTGPFILTDYIEGSRVDFSRNDDYWQYDPINTGNKLPYLDGVRQLIIPDLSTQIASFRTGKLDTLPAVTWEDHEILMRANPDLQYKTMYTRTFLIPAGRTDDPALPFYDVNVRRALNLAVDQQSLLEDFYQGHAVLMGWPYWPIKAHEPFYTPLDEMPASVQELFTYNPEKAKQMLADAGYPDGFKTHIDCRAEDVDYLSILKEFLAVVDVDLEIRPLEAGNFLSVNRGRTHEQMTLSGNYMSWGPWLLHEVRSDSAGNISFWQDEQTDELYNIINTNLGRNNAKWMKAVKDLVPHMLDECWGIWVPAPEDNVMWWPWLQNFYGCTTLGYVESTKYMSYCWIDEDMKEDMGY